MIRQHELIEKIKLYNPDVDEALINRGYIFSMKAHGAQLRANGDPYFSHPLEVASILCDMQMDTDTIIAALLHDTVEDCNIKLEQIDELFGKNIMLLVDGVTKLTKYEQQTSRAKQAENFSKLLIATSKDIRVLLIKLADRLHNMRTIYFIKKPHKRKQKAQETLDIYAPLAGKIGVTKIKDELEDLSFSVLQKDVYDYIMKKLNELERDDDIIQIIVKQIKEIIAQSGINATIYGRLKRPFSIWHKMIKKNIYMDQLLDIVAFRIITENIENCYRVFGILHTNYKALPARVKDYISTPKSNGYQSLHTGVMGPNNQRIEVQIRTQAMHKIAEFGVAAHWPYKDPSKVQTDMINNLVEIHAKSTNYEEFLETCKLEMYQKKVFCFSPNGFIKELPEGATPIDFAYSVHSELGNKCESAKVNGKPVPLMTRLKNGDQVEIITSETQHPSPSWEQFVVTGKAKVNIRKFIRTKKPGDCINLGKQIIKQAISKHGIEFNEQDVTETLAKFNFDNINNLYDAVATGKIKINEVVYTIYPEQCKQLPASNGAKDSLPNVHKVSISGLVPGIAINYSQCCYPLPGDHVVGIIMPGRGVFIHMNDCSVLKTFANEPDRWIDISLDNHKQSTTHTGKLSIIADNNPGSLGRITSIIGQHNSNISNLKVITRSKMVFELHVNLEVTQTSHLSEIIAHLRAADAINKVKRI